MKIIFLGTGGSTPTPERNLPAVALKRDRELLLFDCGEGTQRQMIWAGLSPLKVRAVFLTHFHGDHFFGLPGLIHTMTMMNRERGLEVYGPPGTEELVGQMLGLGRHKLSFEVDPKDLEAGEEVRLKGCTVKTCEVEHLIQTFAYAVVEDPRPGKLYPERAIALGVKPGPDFSKLKAGRSVRLPNGRVIRPEEVVGPPRPGRKVVYAIDTRPCRELIKLAQGADVLIHDSTLGDDLLERAIESGHSTPSEAAEVARKAGVKKLVLIHVSPRYHDASPLLEQAKARFEDVVVAKDLMELEIPLQD